MSVHVLLSPGKSYVADRSESCKRRCSCRNQQKLCKFEERLQPLRGVCRGRYILICWKSFSRQLMIALLFEGLGFSEEWQNRANALNTAYILILYTYNFIKTVWQLYNALHAVSYVAVCVFSKTSKTKQTQSGKQSKTSFEVSPFIIIIIISLFFCWKPMLSGKVTCAVKFWHSRELILQLAAQRTCSAVKQETLPRNMPLLRWMAVASSIMTSTFPCLVETQVMWNKFLHDCSNRVLHLQITHYHSNDVAPRNRGNKQLETVLL